MRRTSLGVVLIIGAVLFAACSSGTPTTSVQSSSNQSTSTTTTSTAPSTTTTTTAPPTTTTTGKGSSVTSVHTPATTTPPATTVTTSKSHTTTPTGGKKVWSGRTITFGAVFSTTGSGQLYGQLQVQGVNLALAQINASGGINGAHLKVSITDDGSDPATAATDMTTFAKAGALAVLGPTFTNSAYVADPVANTLGLPILAVSNTGPGIVGTCSYPCSWIFRDSLGDATGIPVNVNTYVGKSHPSKAVVIAPTGDTYGAQTGQLATNAFTAAGVSAGPPVIVPATEPALAQAVAAALASKPGVLMITASSPTVVSAIIVDARKSGFTGGILGGNAFNLPAVAKAAGTSGRNAQSAAGWYVGDNSPVNTSFISSYMAKYHAAPNQFVAQAYTGLELLAAAAKSAPLNFTNVTADRGAFRTSLENVSLLTPLGPFQFTADHDVYQPVWIVAMNGRGGYRLVKRVPPTEIPTTTTTTTSAGS